MTTWLLLIYFTLLAVACQSSVARISYQEFRHPNMSLGGFVPESYETKYRRFSFCSRASVGSRTRFFFGEEPN